MRDHLAAAAGVHHDVLDLAGVDERGPVHAVRRGIAGLAGQCAAGVAGQGQLDGGPAERPAHQLRVVVLDGDPQQRGGLLVGLGVRSVEPDQPVFEHRRHRGHRRTQPGERERGLAVDVEPGQHELHRVAPAAEHVQGDLQPPARWAAADPAHRHPVQPQLGERDRREIGDDIRPGVRRGGNLIEQLGGDGADRDGAAGAGVLGDDGRAVGGEFGHREADSQWLGHLLGDEGVVAAGCLGAALQDVADHDRTGKGVPGVPGPAKMGCRRADHERGVGHPPGHDDLRAGPQRSGDAPRAEIGVGRQRGAAAERLTGVEVGELEPGDAGQQVVALDVRHRQGHAEAVGEGPDRVGAGGGGEAAGVDHDLRAALTDQAEHVLELAQKGRRVAPGGVLPAGPEQDEHRQFSQVVTGHDIHGSVVEHLGQGRHPVTEEAGAVRQPKGLHALMTTSSTGTAGACA